MGDDIPTLHRLVLEYRTHVIPSGQFHDQIMLDGASFNAASCVSVTAPART